MYIYLFALKYKFRPLIHVPSHISESENLSSVSEILNSKEISDIKRRSVTPGDGNNEPKPMSSSSCYDNYKYDRYHFK